MSQRSNPIPPLALALWGALLTAACTPPEPPAHPRDRIPFQRDVAVEIPAGTASGTVTFTVPPERRLVIEYVSGSVRVGELELVRVNVHTTAAGEMVVHTLPNHTYRRDFPPPTMSDLIVTWGQSLRLYGDPGSVVTVMATRSEVGEVSPTYFALSLSGYLVDCGDEPGCPMR